MFGDRSPRPMQSSSVSFLIKVIVASGLLSAVVKYALPALGVSADPALPLALLLLLGPAALMAALLGIASTQLPPKT